MEIKKHLGLQIWDRWLPLRSMFCLLNKQFITLTSGLIIVKAELSTSTWNRTAIKGSTPARASYKVSYVYAPFRCRWIRWPCWCVSCSVRSICSYRSRPFSRRLARRRVVCTSALRGTRAVFSTAQWGGKGDQRIVWCVVCVANYLSHSVALPWRCLRRTSIIVKRMILCSLRFITKT